MKLKSNRKCQYILIFGLIATQTHQGFLPLQKNTESIFHYELVGSGLVNNVRIGFDSKFNLHVTHSAELKYLINIVKPAGKVGNEELPIETIKALMKPFYIIFNESGAPLRLEYDFQVETNYTIARKELILKQFQEIYDEYQKYKNLEKKELFETQLITNMPFGKCYTQINITTSIIYTYIEYEATAKTCEGNIDPFYTLDMEVDVYPQSEFWKSFAFTASEFVFQYFRLDARLKLKTEPEMYVDIYSLITFNGVNSFIVKEPKVEPNTLSQDIQYELE